MGVFQLVSCFLREGKGGEGGNEGEGGVVWQGPVVSPQGGVDLKQNMTCVHFLVTTDTHQHIYAADTQGLTSHTLVIL